MKTITTFIFAIALIIGACSESEQNKEQLKEELKEELRAELKKESEQELTSESETDTKSKAKLTTVNAKFEMMVANTAGTYFVFTDESGKRLDLFLAPETSGLDFALALRPGDTDHEYYGKPYELSYEEQRVEIKGEMLNRLFVIEAKPLSASGKTKDSGGTAAAFSANDLKNAVFFGTEPFWDIKFYDNFAEKNDPSQIKVKFYYLKNGIQNNFTLSDVIKPKSSNSITLEVTDESGGAAAIVTVTKKQCNDGMSDNIYPYTFSLIWEDGGGWHGCGRVR